ncbi:cytochrome c [bacterium]|nr:cytochrome c [bacterium]
MKRTYFPALIAILFLSLFATCDNSKSSRSERLVDLAAKGKNVFEKNDCGKCHYLGDEVVDAKAPDLTSPFLASDSLFVQAHLKFVEESQMPPISLDDGEIRALSYYISALHSAKHRTISPDKGDHFCPVCFAPVSQAQALNDKLYVKFLDNHYYFECAECLEAFKKAPEAFLDVWRQGVKAKQNAAKF